MAGVDLDVPPPELLGRFLEPGNPDGLLEWYRERASQRAIVSLDMVTFGGLVASRRSEPDLRTARGRLQAWISEVQGEVSVFQSVLRTAPTQTTTEEMRQAGLLVELSCLTAGGAPAEEIERVRSQLPEEAVARYLRTRERNHSLNQDAVAEARRFEAVLLGIDDSKTMGWNVLEVAELAQGLSDNTFIAPGTDESAQLLLARLCNPGREIEVHWSHPDLAAQVTRYEDRPLGLLLESQLAASGLVAVEQSPWQLWIYGRPGPQGEAEEQTEQGPPAGFLESLSRALDSGARVVVADVAHANGGDIGLGRALAPRFRELTGYSAWNTAGNTLGTALGVLGCATEAASPVQQAFLLERWLDDLCYQSIWRPHLKRELANLGL
ncbi:unnamed protein product, partial [Phaeothamnion confervicola]